MDITMNEVGKVVVTDWTKQCILAQAKSIPLTIGLRGPAADEIMLDHELTDEIGVFPGKHVVVIKEERRTTGYVWNLKSRYWSTKFLTVY